MLTRLYLHAFTDEPPPPVETNPPIILEDGTGIEIGGLHNCREDLEAGVIDDSKYVFDPTRPAQTDIFCKQTEEELAAVHKDVRWQRKKFFYTVCCSCSVFAGLAMSLWGMALTLAFSGLKPNLIVFICSFALYIPCLIYVKFMCFPSKKEFHQRNDVAEHRYWRKKLFTTRYKVYMGYDEEERREAEQKKRQEEAAREAERLARYNAKKQIQIKRLRELQEKIGKNQPKLGQFPPSYYREQRLNRATQGMNVIVNRNGEFIIPPPSIIPQHIIESGTAHLIPNYEKNISNEFKFIHPDAEGQKYAIDSGYTTTALAALKASKGLTARPPIPRTVMRPRPASANAVLGRGDDDRNRPGRGTDDVFDSGRDKNVSFATDNSSTMDTMDTHDRVSDKEQTKSKKSRRPAGAGAVRTSSKSSNLAANTMSDRVSGKIGGYDASASDTSPSKKKRRPSSASSASRSTNNTVSDKLSRSSSASSKRPGSANAVGRSGRPPRPTGSQPLDGCVTFDNDIYIDI